MAKLKFLSARWENLLMLNYEVNPQILEPYMPAYTVPDLWQGKALVSMVGFMFCDTRVMGIKWPGYVNFEEVNLRFYVKHFDGKEWKRGAVFVSEIVPKKIIPLIANNLYNEHYKAMPMRHHVEPVGGQQTRYTYEWRLNGRWNKLAASISNDFRPIETDSAEEFIFEHYWGYNRIHGTKTLEYQVEHEAWQIASVSDAVFDADIVGLYDAAFEPYLSQPPFSAFFAKGSAVNVRVAGKILAAPVLPG